MEEEGLGHWTEPVEVPRNWMELNKPDGTGGGRRTKNGVGGFKSGN